MTKSFHKYDNLDLWIPHVLEQDVISNTFAIGKFFHKVRRHAHLLWIGAFSCAFENHHELMDVNLESLSYRFLEFIVIFTSNNLIATFKACGKQLLDWEMPDANRKLLGNSVFRISNLCVNSSFNMDGSVVY